MLRSNISYNDLWLGEEGLTQLSLLPGSTGGFHAPCQPAQDPMQPIHINGVACKLSLANDPVPVTQTPMVHGLCRGGYRSSRIQEAELGDGQTIE